MAILLKHNQMAGDIYGTCKRSDKGRSIARSSNWVEGVWENIGPKPIHVRDKHHLKQICLAESKRTGRTIIPKAFMKPKSQGKGFEWSF